MIVVRHSYISKRDRQSQVKGRPSKAAAVGRALAHIKYIQHRPGEDREPGGRDFFDEDGDKLSAKDLRKAIREAGDSKVVVHKLTLAPEINPVDKREFTREVMHKIACDKGLDLRWMAVEHGNTEHHHIHVVVLGRDKQGKDVRFDKRDYDKIKEHGDRYLERWHPVELERSRSEREGKERDRIEARKRQRETERQERIREGLELPWMHKKIIREQIEPYDKWKGQERQKESQKTKGRERAKKELEKPYRNEVVRAAGKEWSKQNTLSELCELNTHLWDNYEERIEKPEYKKLISWIKDKERYGERSPELDEKGKTPRTKQELSKKTDSFDYQGQKYDKDNSYEKLTTLSKRLRDKKADRLPVEDYQKLRGWMEAADRSRWAGVVDKQLELSKKQYEHEGAKKTGPDANRWTNPLQQQVMNNPVVGMFMQGASVVNELVRWVPLTDTRDRLQESHDDLESSKLDKQQEYVKPGRTSEEKERDQETIEKLDKAIDQNKEIREKADEEKKKQKKKKRDWDRFDPWGQY